MTEGPEHTCKNGLYYLFGLAHLLRGFCSGFRQCHVLYNKHIFLLSAIDIHRDFFVNFLYDSQYLWQLGCQTRFIVTAV